MSQLSCPHTSSTGAHGADDTVGDDLSLGSGRERFPFGSGCPLKSGVSNSRMGKDYYIIKKKKEMALLYSKKILPNLASSAGKSMRSVGCSARRGSWLVSSHSQDTIPSSRCPHKAWVGSHGRAMSHPENTVLCLRLALRGRQGQRTAVCSMIR